RLRLSGQSYFDHQRGYAPTSARRSLAEILFEAGTERRSLSAVCGGTAAKPLTYARKRLIQLARVFLLLLAAHCLLITAQAQPGMPQPNSPLYGARSGSGPVSTGLPNALKKVGIDQKLNEQIPLDAVFKDE